MRGIPPFQFIIHSCHIFFFFPIIKIIFSALFVYIHKVNYEEDENLIVKGGIYERKKIRGDLDLYKQSKSGV